VVAYFVLEFAVGFEDARIEFVVFYLIGELFSLLFQAVLTLGEFFVADVTCCGEFRFDFVYESFV
jgi:hypothetical protein